MSFVYLRSCPPQHDAPHRPPKPKHILIVPVRCLASGIRAGKNYIGKKYRHFRYII